MLVHAGTKQELTVKDNAGFTPVQLASDKGHRNIAFLLVRNFVLILLLVPCMFLCLWCVCEKVEYVCISTHLIRWIWSTVIYIGIGFVKSYEMND